MHIDQSGYSDAIISRRFSGDGLRYCFSMKGYVPLFAGTSYPSAV